MDCAEIDVEKLQNNLLLIRKAGGWSAEEFGDMIGVTKQTISNLENKKTKMTKTQYIAIRAVLDYEIANRLDDHTLSTTVNLCLDADDIPEDKKKQAKAFVEGAAKAQLDTASVVAGLTALIGMAAAQIIVPFVSAPPPVRAAWLRRILTRKR